MVQQSYSEVLCGKLCSRKLTSDFNARFAVRSICIHSSDGYVFADDGVAFFFSDLIIFLLWSVGRDRSACTPDEKDVLADVGGLHSSVIWCYFRCAEL